MAPPAASSSFRGWLPCCCACCSGICTSRAGRRTSWPGRLPGRVTPFTMGWTPCAISGPQPSPRTFRVLFSVAMGVSIFVSTRLMRGPFRCRWYDGAYCFDGAIFACVDVRNHMVGAAARRASDQPDRDFHDCGAAVLFRGFLSARPSTRFGGLSDPRVFAGAVGGADSRCSPATQGWKWLAALAMSWDRSRRCCWASPW